MADETICRNCRRGIVTGLPACPHCDDQDPYTPRVVQPMKTDSRTPVYVTPRPAVATAPTLAPALGCLSIIAVVALLWVWGASREPASSPALDLAAPTTYSLKPGYVACTTQAALEASKPMTDVGDQAALRRFLADPSNGCVLTRANGARVYTERASYGVQRVRPEGSPTSVYVLKEALAP